MCPKNTVTWLIQALFLPIVVFIIVLFAGRINLATSSYYNYNDTLILSHEPLVLGYWSSWNIPCGIATYTSHLVTALGSIGHRVVVYPHTLLPQELVERSKQDAISLLIIQYEPTLYHCITCAAPSVATFKELLIALRRQKIGIIITVHKEVEQLLSFIPEVDAYIYHRPSKYACYFPDLAEKVTLLPMGVPVFKPQRTRDELRAAYNFTPQDRIITTVGFLLPWKEHAVILEKLAAYVKGNSIIKIQLLTSFNTIYPDLCQEEQRKIARIIQEYGIERQVIHSTDFIEQNELNERLWLSDVGYLWLGFQTDSSSAAGREFIASRLPVVLSNSSHYHDLTTGVVKTAINYDQFVATILYMLISEHLDTLRGALEQEYQEKNYEVLIERHIILFRTILAKKVRSEEEISVCTDQALCL